MSYACILYKNSSDPNHMNKSLTLKSTVECNFKSPIDVENPTIYISATDTFDDVNYMYIAEFGRYYFAKCIGGTSQTLTYECVSDPLMSFKSGILASKAVISRNPWHFDMYLPDPKLPIESRTASGIFKFPNASLFDGSRNCYILTTIGSGGGD